MQDMVIIQTYVKHLDRQRDSESRKRLPCPMELEVMITHYYYYPYQLLLMKLSKEATLMTKKDPIASFDHVHDVLALGYIPNETLLKDIRQRSHHLRNVQVVSIGDSDVCSYLNNYVVI